MEGLYPLIVNVHIAGGVAFILIHAVSMVTAFQLRGVRDRERAARLLSRSLKAVIGMYAALLVLLVAGIAAGFIGGHWGRLWIWASIAILVGVMVVMYAIASPYYGELRQGLGLAERKGAPVAAAMSDGELAARVATSRPIWLALVGLPALAAIIALMYTKPF